MGTNELFLIIVGIGAAWIISVAYASYRGWCRGFEAAKKIWKPHGDELTQLWKDAAMKAWAELDRRPV